MSEVKRGEVVEMTSVGSATPVVRSDNVAANAGNGANGALVLLERAIERGMGPEEIRQLMELINHERQRAAETAFDEAMNRVQARMQPIVKRKAGAKAKYAPYEEVDSALRPLYAPEKFSIDFTEDEARQPGHFRLVITVSHPAGHKKSNWGEFPLGSGPSNQSGKSVMTPIQSKTSDISFAKRILLTLAFNVVTCGEDFDGAHQQCDDPPISDQEIMALEDGIKDQIKNRVAFLQWLGVGAVSELTHQGYERAMAEIARLAQGKKQGARP